VAAPAYIGAVIIFLFVLSLFLVKKRTQTWIIASMILALLLSWGKNFSFLTDFFIDYVPLYNKFRAVTSIQVLIELGIPILGILGLQKFLFDLSVSKEKKKQSLLFAGIITAGIALLFMILGGFIFDFTGGNDTYYDSMISGFSKALIQDRTSFLFNDSLRSLVLVGLAVGVLWLFIKEKLKITPVIGILAALLLYDGVGVAKRYVNSEDFMSAKRIDKPFVKSAVDKAILKDKGHYRVANFGVNPMNDGSTSYFHKSIGGYHAAKPRRYQELFDFQIAKNNMEVLNMLNAKYLILTNEKGQKQVQENDKVYGNAWFVSNIQWVADANEEIVALDSLSKNLAIIDNKFKKNIKESIQKDSLASIQLTNYAPNQIDYESNTQTTQLALFSEMYYPHGWKALIDGKEQEIICANYVLRALVVPKGKHRIVFKFEPEVVQKSALFSLVGYLLFLLIIVGWGVKIYLKSKDSD
jgi:hypothetical protein